MEGPGFELGHWRTMEISVWFPPSRAGPSSGPRFIEKKRRNASDFKDLTLVAKDCKGTGIGSGSGAGAGAGPGPL